MTNLRDLLAGIFVLVALLLFLVFLVWAGDIKAWFQTRAEATVLLKRSVPLAEGVAVRYEGIQIGKVASIHLRSREERMARQPDYHVKLVLSLDPTVELTTRTPVSVTADGLLGARYVALGASPDGAPPLPKEEVLLGVLGGVDGLLSGADRLAESLTVLSLRLNRLIDPDGGRGTVADLLTRATGLTDRASGFIDSIEETRRQIDASIKDARQTFGSANRLINDVAPEVRELISQLRSVSEDAKGGVGALRQSIEDLSSEARGTLKRVDDLLVRNDRNIFLALHHLRVAAEELKLAVARVRADPSQVLFGGAEDPNAAEAAARKSQERDLLDKGFLPPRWKR